MYVKNALEQTTLFCSMPRCAVSMITRYCGLVKGLNRNSCHFRPSKNKQKYSAFFVYCYKSGTIFRISCAFHALFPVFRTAFSAHSLLDLPRSTKHNILWFALHQQPCCFLLAPRRGTAVPRWKFPLKKASFSPFFHFQSVAKHLYNMCRYCGAQARPHRAPPACRSMVFDTKEASP